MLNYFQHHLKWFTENNALLLMAVTCLQVTVRPVTLDVTRYGTPTSNTCTVTWSQEHWVKIDCGLCAGLISTLCRKIGCPKRHCWKTKSDDEENFVYIYGNNMQNSGCICRANCLDFAQSF